jgi:hypothetical protein
MPGRRINRVAKYMEHRKELEQVAPPHLFEVAATVRVGDDRLA